MYFLFGILDKERRATDFRDCYPILDKKVESQFRQKAYAWYTGIGRIMKAYILLKISNTLDSYEQWNLISIILF